MGEPVEEHGKLTGLCGHDGTDWQKVGISASARLKVETEASDGTDLKDILDELGDILTELGQKLETNDLELDGSGRLSSNQHHFDGSLWRKSNLLWGYHAIWDENLTGTVDGTSYTKDTGVIPANELWVLQTVSIANADHASSAAYIYITRASGAVLHLAYKDEPPVWDPLIFEGSFIMRTGDVITVLISGCTNGDSIRAGILGYKMDITM